MGTHLFTVYVCGRQVIYGTKTQNGTLAAKILEQGEHLTVPHTTDKIGITNTGSALSGQ